MAFRSGFLRQPTPDVLEELARRNRESNKLMIWTLIGGLVLCLWPIWIVSYLEYNKQQQIRAELSAMGVDVTWWERTFWVK
jgi:hypothetical protein